LAHKLILKDERVLKVILFGSLAEGSYSPHSDADLLIIITGDKRRPMDRIPEYLLHFLPAGISIDIFPFTSQEILEENRKPFFNRILKTAITLAERKD